MSNLSRSFWKKIYWLMETLGDLKDCMPASGADIEDPGHVEALVNHFADIFDMNEVSRLQTVTKHWKPSAILKDLKYVRFSTLARAYDIGQS